MTEKDAGPWIPTAAELSGGEMDYATEHAARYRNLANQHERGTPQAESALWMAEVMKAYAAELRAGAFDQALDYQRLRGSAADSAEDGAAR